MDSKKYASALKNAEYKSHVWLACGAVLLIANLMLAMAVISADSNEKTIIVPAGFNTPFTVEGNKVSPEYIEQMGRYFGNLLLTFHERNAQAQFDTVLRYTHPSAYSELKTQFDVDVDRIRRNDISSVFYLMKIYVKGNVAIITGELNGLVGSQLVSKRQKSYELAFNYDGDLTILSFKEVAANSVGDFEAVEKPDEVMIEQEAGSSEG